MPSVRGCVSAVAVEVSGVEEAGVLGAEVLAASPVVLPAGSWGLFCAATASWNWPRRSMMALKPARDSNYVGRGQVGENE